MIAACLERLLAKVDRDAVAITGGLATGHYVPERRRECLRDLDFVAARMEAISPAVTEHFLVSHFHRVQPGVPKAIVQLVDPLSRLRIDLFPDLAGIVPRAQWIVIEGVRLRAVDPESLLEHKLRSIARASPGQPVDEKHWLDAVALAARTSRPIPPRPGHLGHDVYSQDVDAICDRCELSRDPAFPLAPRTRIRDILGYV